MNHKPLILYADDNIHLLEGWKAILEQQGYEVLTAADGREALQQFISHPVDLALVDYHMPHMNGDVVAAHMKACKTDVPIALLSADAPPTNIEVADAIVSKTESITAVLRIVDHLLSLRFLFEPLDGWGVHDDAA